MKHYLVHNPHPARRGFYDEHGVQHWLTAGGGTPKPVSLADSTAALLKADGVNLKEANPEDSASAHAGEDPPAGLQERLAENAGRGVANVET